MADEMNMVLGANPDPPVPPTPTVIYGYLYANDGGSLLYSYKSRPSSGYGPIYYYYEEDGDDPRGIYNIFAGKFLNTDLSEYAGLSTIPNVTNPDVNDGTFINGYFYVVPKGGGYFYA